eukprot:UN16101
MQSNFLQYRWVLLWVRFCLLTVYQIMHQYMLRMLFYLMIT